jgi:GGDEF domain-containing protein
VDLRDPLTQLPTEALFMDRLSQALALARRKGSRIGVIQLSLAGTNIGADSVLVQALARRTEEQLRNTDSVCRREGGFTVLLNDVDSQQAARAVAEELVIALGRPLSVDGTEHKLTARFGLAVYPDDADDEQRLLAGTAAELGEVRRAG